MSALRIANLGAEEGPSWREHKGEPAVAAVAALWRELFEAEGREPAFPWLPGPAAAAAWLNTEEAHEEAAAAGQALAGPAPSVVRRVHDKAFAVGVAGEEGLEPPELEGTSVVLEPDALSDPEGALRTIEAAVARWPTWLGGRFTLKPRHGTSGRGRTGGRAGALDRAALRGALPRLAARGGAILEPWLERLEDLSAQLVAGADGGLLLLGTLRTLCTGAGAYRGHAGTLDRKSRVTSGSRFDEALRESAVVVAARAAAQGFTGPCGVDALVFRGPSGEPTLRSVVEFNARYTVGTVVIGHARRRRRAVTAPLHLDAGERAHFRFAPLAPPGGWPPERRGHSVCLRLCEAPEAAGAALWAARSQDDAEAALP